MTKLIKKNNNKKGFSLVEMITVVAIIVIIASIAAFNLIGVYRHVVYDVLYGEGYVESSSTQKNP